MNRLRKYAIWAHQELVGKIQRQIQILKIAPSADAEAIARRLFIRICALRFMEVNGLSDGVFLHVLTDAVQTTDFGVHSFIDLCDALHLRMPDVFPAMDETTRHLIPEDLFAFDGIIERLVNDIPKTDFDAVHGIGVEIVGWLYQYFISETREEIIDPLYKKYITKNDIPTATQVFTPDWLVQYIVDNSLGHYWIEHHPNSRLAEKLAYYISNSTNESLAPDKNTVVKIQSERKNQKPSPSSVQRSLFDALKNDQASSHRFYPSEITILDPCVGAGHFLVYAIDVLMHIYRENGFSDCDAIRLIIRHNIYGLDIDNDVIQIARFAVIMKGCRYDPDFLSQGITPQIYQIRDLENIDTSNSERLCKDDKQLKDRFDSILQIMKHAGGLGSIIQLPDISDAELSKWCFKSGEIREKQAWEQTLNVIQLLSSKYDIVITNPPYLNKYDDILKAFIQKHYKAYSGDLFSVFIYRCLQFCKPGGYAGLMTPNVWMFIKSYEKLRRYILTHHAITTLVQLAKGAFFDDATVDVCAFVMQSQITGKSGTYFRLENFPGRMKMQRQKLAEAIHSSASTYRYTVSSELFKSLPGMQIGYWIGEAMIRVFRYGKPLSKLASPRQGLATTDNNKYLRHWYEIDIHEIGFGLDRQTAIHSDIKWFPYNKGGEFRKWYGNQDYVVNYRHDGEEIKRDVLTKYPYLKTPDYVVKNPDTYFAPSLSWSKISSGSVAFRFFPQGFLYDVSGCSIFFNNQPELYLYAGFLNSIVCKKILEILSPTLNYEAGHISALPILDFEKYRERIQTIVKDNIALSHEDWNLSETSWEFKRHPLINHCQNNILIKDLYLSWKHDCEHRFNRLKSNEEALNRIYIDLYGLQNELSPEVEDRDVTVRKADLSRDIKSLISYAVGCMFGRYVLDKEGLCFTGGDFARTFVKVGASLDNPDEYKCRCYPKEAAERIHSDQLLSNHFGADANNIIPVSDNACFDEDIVTRFVEFIRLAYGSETLEENLRFIANALGSKGNPLDIIRSYFLNDFYPDHIKTYQKRPIYWMFSSGKKNGFKCIIYIHRYQQDTITRILNDYICKSRSRYQTIISEIESRLKTVAVNDAAALEKQLTKYKAQAEEVCKYEKKMHPLAEQMISIDLDDGIKFNYAKFGDVLQVIK